MCCAHEFHSGLLNISMPDHKKRLQCNGINFQKICEWPLLSINGTPRSKVKIHTTRSYLLWDHS